METNVVVLLAVLGIIFFSIVLWFFSRYKKCPSDKIMVIYGRVGKNKDGSSRSAKCIHGGAAFIVPVILIRFAKCPRMLLFSTIL